MTKNRERFDALLAEWRVNEDALGKMQDQQRDLVESVNKCFAQIITEEQMLADLPWLFEVYGHGANLSCQIKDDKVQAFLDKLHWERLGWHAAIKMGEHYVSLNDGHMSIHLESVDEMVAFCKEQGIAQRSTF